MMQSLSQFEKELQVKEYVRVLSAATGIDPRTVRRAFEHGIRAVRSTRSQRLLLKEAGIRLIEIPVERLEG